MFLRPNAILSAATRVASAQRTRMTVAAPTIMFARMYASLPKEDVQTRVLDVVKSFDKVDASKVKYIHD
jgi:NADH dehydrogenase (ubiquinone) 1 alpha/beta subcomplex 1